MAKRQINLTEQEIASFRRREDETGDKQKLYRLQTVRACGTGQVLSAIISVLDCHSDSVRKWAMQYEREGLSELTSKWSRKNAAKLNDARRAELKQRLREKHPDELIAAEKRLSRGAFWTVSDVAIVVAEWYEVRFLSSLIEAMWVQLSAYPKSL